LICIQEVIGSTPISSTKKIKKPNAVFKDIERHYGIGYFIIPTIKTSICPEVKQLSEKFIDILEDENRLISNG
jgi:hypothetical protein